MSDFSDQLRALRDAALRYALSLEDQKEFLLRDVPEYANNTNISGSMRIRLARSINEMICKSQKDGSLSSIIERVYRKDGTTPKLRGGAAVYRKKGEKVINQYGGINITASDTSYATGSADLERHQRGMETYHV